MASPSGGRFLGPSRPGASGPVATRGRSGHRNRRPGRADPTGLGTSPDGPIPTPYVSVDNQPVFPRRLARGRFRPGVSRLHPRVELLRRRDGRVAEHPGHGLDAPLMPFSRIHRAGSSSISPHGSPTRGSVTVGRPIVLDAMPRVDWCAKSPRPSFEIRWEEIALEQVCPSRGLARISGSNPPCSASESVGLGCASDQCRVNPQPTGSEPIEPASLLGFATEVQFSLVTNFSL